SCHTSSNPNNIELDGTPQQVYDALVNVTPVNSVAAANGMKEVDPGNPRNSFLFAKINHGLDYYFTLKTGEGIAMPDSNVAMTQTQREMVRQWILFGAQDTGTWVSMATIDSFYVTQGGQPRVTPLAPPDPSQGEQFYFGPIFMRPGVEFEYNHKYKVHNNETIDVNRMKVDENPETHHFAIYDFLQGHDGIIGSGLNKVVGISDEAFLFYNANVVAQWPKPMDVTYPNGTALVWDSASVLCLDYHLINYEDYVIAAEAYLNVYYQPHQSSTIPLQTAQVRYGGDDVDQLVIPNNGVDTTFRINQFSPDSDFYWNIISLQAHTHKHGTNFFVWSRKANGQKDSLIYNGQYNPDYSQFVGTYSWNDPPYRQFNEPYPIYMGNGMIHEATFFNSGPDTVHFGLSTEDEMYVTFIIYYKSEFPYSGIGEVQKDKSLDMYPNPASDVEYIKLDNSLVMSHPQMQFFDALGRKVLEINDIATQVFSADVSQLPNGLYTYRLVNGGEVVGSGKMVVQR
ncbi:MAG TPA: T9SS type A sorting domain-containing protein, partial [Chitinophagales bacterium]|nr:T9SS type A sorting domain-containing protein [Chitinophagales bacterium]